MSLDFAQVWIFVALLFLRLLLSAGLIAFAFLGDRGRISQIRVRAAGAGGRGTVSSDELNSGDR